MRRTEWTSSLSCANIFDNFELYFVFKVKGSLLIILEKSLSLCRKKFPGVYVITDCRLCRFVFVRMHFMQIRFFEDVLLRTADAKYC